MVKVTQPTFGAHARLSAPIQTAEWDPDLRGLVDDSASDRGGSKTCCSRSAAVLDGWTRWVYFYTIPKVKFAPALTPTHHTHTPPHKQTQRTHTCTHHAHTMHTPRTHTTHAHTHTRTAHPARTSQLDVR